MARRTWKFTVMTFYRLVFVLVMLTGLAWLVELSGLTWQSLLSLIL